eukprot:7359191-Alexandrium_andersonii.AAC.1
MVRHASVRHLLWSWCKAAGFLTLQEQTVPALSSGDKGTAVLDVEAVAHAFAKGFCADVSVRHPCAAHNLAGARCVAGHAAQIGDSEKFKRYGDQVTPCSVEVWGKLSPIFADCMFRLAKLASQRQEFT